MGTGTGTGVSGDIGGAVVVGSVGAAELLDSFPSSGESSKHSASS